MKQWVINLVTIDFYECIKKLFIIINIKLVYKVVYYIKNECI